jgi:hypothetical protein
MVYNFYFCGIQIPRTLKGYKRNERFTFHCKESSSVFAVHITRQIKSASPGSAAAHETNKK